MRIVSSRKGEESTAGYVIYGGVIRYKQRLYMLSRHTSTDNDLLFVGLADGEELWLKSKDTVELVKGFYTEE